MIAGLIWLARIGVYLGLFVGVGGVFFAAWIGWGPYGERIDPGFAEDRSRLCGVFARLAGARSAQPAARRLLTLAPWKGALGTSFGPSMLIAIVSMAVARYAWQSPTMTIAWVLTSLTMVGVGLSLATSGHAATASPQWLTPTLVFVHGVAVAYWVGALAPLADHGAAPAQRRCRGRSGNSRTSPCRWSGVGAVRHCACGHSARKLWRADRTWYGIILLIKLVLASLLARASPPLNRLYLDAGHRARRVENTRTFGGSVLLEFLLVLCISSSVAGWRFTTPPRALAESAPAPLAIHIHTETAMFQVLISPGKVGLGRFRAATDDRGRQPVPGQGSDPDAEPAGARHRADRAQCHAGAGRLLARRGVPLPQPGRWHMQIDALVTDFEKVTLEDDFEVK